MILPQEPDLLIEKDVHGVIRELRHLQMPAEGEPGQSAKQAALEYLRLASGADRQLLPLNQDDLNHLEKTSGPGERSRSPDSRFGWSEPRDLERNDRVETTIVWCQ